MSKPTSSADAPLASNEIVRAVTELNLTGRVIREGKRPLAYGGFSDVWLGNRRDSRGQTSVAIKVMKSFSKKSGVLPYERILVHLYREIHKWKDLNHVNILKLQGFVIEKDGGWVGLVADWLPNGDAMSYLGANPEVDREALILDSAKGLHYLHSLPTPLVHGDMKGENILINERGVGCIGDFGLADFTDHTCRKTGFTTSTLVQGSLRWASPELLNDDEPIRTPASDVWAFGCTALQLATSKVPYWNKNDAGATLAIAMAEPQTADTDYPDWFTDHSDNLWELFAECWKEEVEERISMAKVLETLKEEFEKPDLSSSIVETRVGSWTTLSNTKASTQLSVELEKQELPTGLFEIHTITISSDEQHVAMTGISDQPRVRIMHWPDWKEVKSLQKSTDCLAFTPDSTAVVIAEVREITICRLRDRQVSGGFASGHPGNISKLAFSKDGTLLATVGWTDKTVRIWRLIDLFKAVGSSKPATITPITIINTEVQIGSFSFSPDGRHALGGTYNGFRLWKLPETPSGSATLINQVIREPSNFRGYHTPAVFNPDSRGGVIANPDGRAEQWTWDNLITGKNNSVKALQVSYVPVMQDYVGNSVLTDAGWFISFIGCTMHLWHTPTLEDSVNTASLSLISGRRQTSVIASLSPKTKFLITAKGQLDETLQIWRVQSRS